MNRLRWPPIAAGLLLIAAFATPVAGAEPHTYVLASVTMQSEPGDYIGDGQAFTFVNPTDPITAEYGIPWFSNVIHVAARNDAHWFDFMFSAADGAPTTIGLYPDARRGGIYGWLSGAGHPGLDVSADSKGCNQTYGWFQIDALEVNDANIITKLDLTFEQRCEWADAPILRGNIQVGLGPADPNPKLSFFTADCTKIGTLEVSAPFFVSDTGAGATSSFNVVGTKQRLIVLTPGTDRQAYADGSLCEFTWLAGWRPRAPWDQPWQALAFITPQESRNLALGAAVTASSELADMPASAAVDGDPTTFWNAGGFPPQWIEIDLGRDYPVAAVQLMIAQYPSGYTEHQILGRSSTDTDYTVLDSFLGTTVDPNWLTTDFAGPVKLRYVRVETNFSPSWVAWREVTVLVGGAVK